MFFQACDVHCVFCTKAKHRSCMRNCCRSVHACACRCCCVAFPYFPRTLATHTPPKHAHNARRCGNTTNNRQHAGSPAARPHAKPQPSGSSNANTIVICDGKYRITGVMRKGATGVLYSAVQLQPQSVWTPATPGQGPTPLDVVGHDDNDVGGGAIAHRSNDGGDRAHRAGDGDGQKGGAATATGAVGPAVLKVEECAAPKRQMQNEWQVGGWVTSVGLGAADSGRAGVATLFGRYYSGWYHLHSCSAFCRGFRRSHDEDDAALAFSYIHCTHRVYHALPLGVHVRTHVFFSALSLFPCFFFLLFGTATPTLPFCSQEAPSLPF